MKLLENVNNIYMVGIKGVGMSGLAQILKGLGFRVQGSDTKEVFFTDRILKKQGITFKQGFSAKNIPMDIDLCISSSAYLNKKNCEIEAFKDQGTTIKSYSEIVAALFSKCGLRIAIAGSHGKSTTTAMLATILEECGKDPLCLVGTEVLKWESNARIPLKLNQQKKLPVLLSKVCFVLEADEYQSAFLNYHPNILIITNIDYDHPDFFESKKAYQAAFSGLMANMEPGGFMEVKKPHLIAYSQQKPIKAMVQQASNDIKPHYFSKPAARFDLKFPGIYNQLNASAAYKCAQVLNLDLKKARRALENFQGTRRRFEIRRVNIDNKEVIFVDDYAHHPTEIRAVLGACFEKFPQRKIITIFQPHTFSRTKAFFEDFIDILKNAPNLIIVRTYGSARENKGDIRAYDLYQALKKKKKDIHYKDSIKQTADFLNKNVRADNVILTLGAGNVWKVREILQ